MTILGPNGQPFRRSHVPILAIMFDSENGVIQVFDNRDLINRLNERDRKETVKSLKRIVEQDFAVKFDDV